jgi:hypothetical protein
MLTREINVVARHMTITPPSPTSGTVAEHVPTCVVIIVDNDDDY